MRDGSDSIIVRVINALLIGLSLLSHAKHV